MGAGWSKRTKRQSSTHIHTPPTRLTTMEGAGARPHAILEANGVDRALWEEYAEGAQAIVSSSERWATVPSTKTHAAVERCPLTDEMRFLSRTTTITTIKKSTSFATAEDDQDDREKEEEEEEEEEEEKVELCRISVCWPASFRHPWQRAVGLLDDASTPSPAAAKETPRERLERWRAIPKTHRAGRSGSKGGPLPTRDPPARSMRWRVSLAELRDDIRAKRAGKPSASCVRFADGSGGRWRCEICEPPPSLLAGIQEPSPSLFGEAFEPSPSLGGDFAAVSADFALSREEGDVEAVQRDGPLGRWAISSGDVAGIALACRGGCAPVGLLFVEGEAFAERFSREASSRTLSPPFVTRKRARVERDERTDRLWVGCYPPSLAVALEHASGSAGVGVEVVLWEKDLAVEVRWGRGWGGVVAKFAHDPRF
jgi:hypothetical protein